MDAKQLENFNGPIGQVEIDYLDAISVFVQKYLHEARDFRGAMERLWLEIRRVVVSLRGDMPIPEIVHWNVLSIEPASDALPLSEMERSFLEDMVGFIDYSIRNGLRFDPVYEALSHDIDEIAEHEYKLADARKMGWLPKVQGYAGITEDSFGGVEEPSQNQ